MAKVVIIMPAYKEAENIKKMIPELFDNVFPKIEKADMHLLVMNDLDSKDKDDGTGDIVRNYQEKYENLHILEHKKEGLGWAYIRGMKHAMNNMKADAVMEMDADFQHPPRFVPPMVEAFLKGADYVIGSRYIPGGSIPKEWAIHRKAMSYFGNLYARIVLTKFSIHDMTTGFRLTKVRGVLENVDLDHLREPHMFAHKIDLLYQSIKNAKNVVEVPLEFASRTEETSKFNIKEMIASYKTVMILGILDKKKFIKFGTVGFIGYLVNASALFILTKAQAPGWIAWGGSTELAIISNFVLNNLWTFREQKITGVSKWIYKFFQFNLTSGGALLIQVGAGSVSDKIIGVEYRQLALPAIIGFLVLPYNYFMYNVVIWKAWKLKGKKKK